MNSKNRILAKASKLIHAKGFNNTSIQNILDETAVTKSNFYYHFDSKEQLGFDVLARRMEQFHAFVIAPSLENRDLGPAEQVDVFLDRMLALTSMPEGELGCPFGNLAQEMSTIHEPLRKALSEFFHRGAEKLAQCFEEGKKIGDFRGDLPSKRVAEFILAQLQGSLLLRKTHKDIEILESNFELLRQTIKGWS